MIDHRLLEQTRGFLDPEEGEALYDCALRCADVGPCLEIGSYCGRSALYLGTACRATGNTLFSIDHHRGSEEQQPGELYFDPRLFDPRTYRVDTFADFRETLTRAGLSESVVPIVSASATAARAWRTPLGLVFIDGGHAYETVLSDYLSWERHLLPGGFMLFHDIYPHPDQGGQAPFEIYRMALASGAYTEHVRVKSLGILHRRSA